MKHLKIALIALFTFVMVANVNAQDSDNPWAISLGVNTVDFYGGGGFTDNIKDLLGNGDWNVLPSISTFAATKYLEDGFSLQLMGSLNKITFLNSENDSDFMYYSIDANVKYDVNKLVDLTFGSTTQYFDPFVYLGGAYAVADGNGEAMLNVGVGFNTWFKENIGLTFQTGTKKGFTDNVNTHYQSSLGVVFKFGGKDTDGDGVYDKDDSCPDVAGLAAFNGCPDADGDGVQDSKDACPNVAGLAALNGCPDADGDGIADKDDMCPNEKGSSANRGCPDSDGDGVVNKDDKCPNVAGPAANGGCPWPDTDGDGVLDKDDQCPNEAGTVANNGCPEINPTVEVMDTLNEYAITILFDTGKATFKKETDPVLKAMTAIFKEYPKASFTIEGHTDSVGSEKSNQLLSERRANAVKDYLVANGISDDRLSAVGYGEAQPIDDNKTRAGRANNRRVEVKLND